MGKFLGILAAILVVIAIVLMLFLGKGFGFGKGSGDGNGNGVNTEQDVNVGEKLEVQDETEEDEEVTVIIEVKQSQYLIDGEEKTFSEIESLIANDSAENISFILEDNYASAKAWDEIKTLFTKYEIDVVEQ